MIENRITLNKSSLERVVVYALQQEIPFSVEPFPDEQFVIEVKGEYSNLIDVFLSQTGKANQQVVISPLDALVSSVYSEYRPGLVSVTTCANTVRVEREGIPGAYLQKDATEPDSLWKVFVDGDYILGMETLHDGFRIVQFLQQTQVRDTSSLSEEKIIHRYIQSNGAKCVVCLKSENEGGAVTIEPGGAWQKVWCNSCGTEWTDNYKLVGVTDLNTNVPFLIGEQVKWSDPDEGISSGLFTVKSILAEDTVLLFNEAGSEFEVPTSEVESAKTAPVSELSREDLVQRAKECCPADDWYELMDCIDETPDEDLVKLIEKHEEATGPIGYMPELLEGLIQELTANGLTLSGDTKKVDIKLAAFTRLEYMETIDVPIEFGECELNRLVDLGYDAVDEGDYWDDPVYWERATCSHSVSDLA